MEDKVVFKGHAKDIKEVWRNNHLLVLPSLGEGTPLSLIEAMVSGRTAVVTDVGDNAIFINQKTGFLSDAPTVKCIDEAMESAWSQNEQWELLGKEAHKFASSQIDKYPEDTLLKDILQNKIQL